MSSESKLRDIIRELIRNELEEATSNASVGNASYKTPHSFAGNNKKGKRKKKAGYSGGHTNPTVSTDNFHAKDPKLRKEGKYHDYRNDDTLSAKQKIGSSMREVRDSLTQLEGLVKMNVKLKNELNVDSRDYWKNTHKALRKISERLVKLANKVGQLQ